MEAAESSGTMVYTYLRDVTHQITDNSHCFKDFQHTFKTARLVNKVVKIFWNYVPILQSSEAQNFQRHDNKIHNRRAYDCLDKLS
jgi:hypothetical protein